MPIINKAILKRLEKQKLELGKLRDELSKLRDEIECLEELSREAHDSLEYTIDTLSQYV